MDRLLIKGGLLVTSINEAYETLRLMEGDILIEEGFITEIGKDLKHEGTVIDARGKCVLPGFVNAHSHSLSSVLIKGLIEGQNLGRLGNKLYHRISQITEIALSVLSPEEIESLLRFALSERADGGTTTILEQGSIKETESWKRLSVETGLRIEIVPIDQDISSPFENKGPGDENLWISPILPEDWESDRLRSIRVALQSRKARILMNMPETRAEMIAFQERFGTTPIRHLSDAGLLDPRLTISHCLYADESEQRQLRETGARVIHCRPILMEELPETSFWFHPISKSNLAIGTDLHSGDMLSMLREVSLTVNLYARSTDKIKTPDLFFAATVGGARVLGREDLGRIVEGYRADLLIFNTRPIRLRPLAFPLINAIHHGSSSDIEAVIAGGKIVKEEGRLLGFQEETVPNQAEEAVWKTWAHCRRLGVL